MPAKRLAQSSRNGRRNSLADKPIYPLKIAIPASIRFSNMPNHPVVSGAPRRRESVRYDDVLIDVITEGSGPAVVLLPSLGRDSEDYDEVAAGIAQAGFLVLRPQPRGLGGSRGPMIGITLADLARDVERSIDALADGPALIVGHAFGNWVARMTATRFPRAVRGVVIAAAAAKRYPAELTKNIHRIANPLTSQEDRLRYLQETFFAPGNDASVWLDGWHSEIRDSQFNAHLATDQSEWWAAGTAPLLDLQAAQDPFKPVHSRTELRDELGPRVSIAVIENASHALLPEQPAAVVDAVIRWIENL